MKIWKIARESISNMLSRQKTIQKTPTEIAAEQGDYHLKLAQESLQDLLHDQRVPNDVRHALAEDYEQIEIMLDKLENGHVHIAVVGLVGVGKSSLLNALLGEDRFSTSPLHGETKSATMVDWQSFDTGGVFLIDTPGINEIDGESREKLAHEIASRADLVLFVLDSDITETELHALRIVAHQQRPILLVINKIDRYHEDEKSLLRNSLEMHTASLVDPQNIVFTTAQPSPQIVIYIDKNGKEKEDTRSLEPNIEQLQIRLWEILEKEGKSLIALNAGIFAGNLSDQIMHRIFETRRLLSTRVVRTYCIAKGIAVALNPIPVADLVAAVVMDATMVIHLGKIYALPLTRKEAGSLVQVIAAQMLALMGTVWAVNLLSSALKAGTGGFSTLVTAGGQGAIAYYSTYVVGQVAKRYLAQGKSWGDGGPKQVVREIIEGLDRSSIMNDARSEILSRLKTKNT